MTLYTDVHVLTPVGPNNLNRSETGAPKTSVFGGKTRHRLSSQSQKYAVRGDFIDTYGDELTSLRSRSLPSLIALRLQEEDPSLSVEDARKLAAYSLAHLNKGNTDKNVKAVTKAIEEAASKNEEYKPELPATFQISDNQARAFAKAVTTARANGVDFLSGAVVNDKDLIEELQETIREKNTADVLLFGRMHASNNSLSVDAACQVAHAIGVSEYAGDVDAFIAADEISTRHSELADAIREARGDDKGGADMPPTDKGISAGTMYRYANVNATALAASTGSKDDAADIIGKFIKSFSTVLPGGAQNSHAARSPFSTLVVTLRTTAPMSYVGAFEVPVDNAVEASKALSAFAKNTSDMYGEPVGEKVFVLSLYDRDGIVEALGADGTVSTLPELIDAVTAFIKAS